VKREQLATCVKRLQDAVLSYADVIRPQEFPPSLLSLGGQTSEQFGRSTKGADHEDSFARFGDRRLR
jgi:hypothetical protein